MARVGGEIVRMAGVLYRLGRLCANRAVVVVGHTQIRALARAVHPDP
jgi:hypothetical protein